MNDDDHDTHEDYLARQEEAASDEVVNLRASCTHQRVIYRPVGGNAMGWTPVWVCERCSVEFVPRTEADLRGSQLLMVSSELAGDPKMDHADRSDPRWTPTLHEAWCARQKHKEDAAQIVDLMHERDGWKEHSGALMAARRAAEEVT